MEQEAQEGPAKPSRSQRRERAAADALRTYVRDVASRELEPHKLPDRPLRLRLDLAVDAGADWAVAFTPALREQVLEQVADQLAERRVFQPGRVFCFRCGHAGCEHGAPPTGRHVFQGYGSTGEPAWHELSQAFIEARDERVDELFGRQARVVCLAQSGKSLKAEQLTSFGRASKAYALLGQVVAGFFPVQDQEDVAVTFQFVESRSAAGAVQVRLNPVANLPSPIDWEEWLLEEDNDWIRRIVVRTEGQLLEIEQRINEAGADRYTMSRKTLGRIPRMMQSFAQTLERGHRQLRRRTRHSQVRRREQRPVGSALADARRAPDGRWLEDLHESTMIVAGPQHRYHVFNERGTHVTSFTGNGETLKRRVNRGRWKVLDPSRVEALRAEIMKNSGTPGIGDSDDG